MLGGKSFDKRLFSDSRGPPSPSPQLLNVVVAVLLDEFISSVQREKEEAERRERLQNDKKKISGFLDPLTGVFVCVCVCLCVFCS